MLPALLLLMMGALGTRPAESRTIKTTILTNGDGVKEMRAENATTREIKSIVEKLGRMNITVAVTTVAGDGEETTPPASVPEESTERPEELNEDILMKHWNSLTEVGWNAPPFARRPLRRLYVNNTRVLEFGTEEPKNGRQMWGTTEDVTEQTTTEETETEQPAEVDSSVVAKLVEAVRFVLECATDARLRDAGVLQCAATRLRALIYPIWQRFDEDLDGYLETLEACPTRNQTATERTFYHRQRRFIYHVVLPLLVLVLIKYLVALPFLLLGVFAVKSLFLAAFSAGTATLHSIAKKFEYLVPRLPIKRYRGVQGMETAPGGTAGVAGPGGNFFWPPGPWVMSEEGRGGVLEQINM